MGNCFPNLNADKSSNKQKTSHAQTNKIENLCLESRGGDVRISDEKSTDRDSMKTDLNKICIQRKNSNINLAFVPSESGNVDVELHLPSRNEKDEKNLNFNDPRT